MNITQVFALGIAGGSLIGVAFGFILGWSTRDQEVRKDGRQA